MVHQGPWKAHPGSTQPTGTQTTRGGWEMGGVSGWGHICVEASGCAHHVGNYDHRGDRCLRGGDNATVSPGSVGGCAVGVVGARGVGCCGGCLQRADLGVLGVWGCIGSMHVSLGVGGGEDVGGWELISWSLVSMQSLDVSPCLAASSQPTPARLGLTVVPHLPQNPTVAHQTRPGSVPQSPPALSTRSGQGVSTKALPRGGKEQLLSYI